MAEKQSSVQELLEEVRAIRDAVDVIEKRTIYMRPDGLFVSARKQIVGGVLHGAGLLLGGLLFLAIFGFIVQHTLSSEKVQGMIGSAIETAITNSIHSQFGSFPSFK